MRETTLWDCCQITLNQICKHFLKVPTVRPNCCSHSIFAHCVSSFWVLSQKEDSCIFLSAPPPHNVTFNEYLNNKGLLYNHNFHLQSYVILQNTEHAQNKSNACLTRVIFCTFSDRLLSKEQVLKAKSWFHVNCLCCWFPPACFGCLWAPTMVENMQILLVKESWKEMLKSNCVQFYFSCLENDHTRTEICRSQSRIWVQN